MALRLLPARRVLVAAPASRCPSRPLLDERLGRLLHARVERREDAQPALVDALPAEPLDQLAADLLLEIQAEGLADLEAVGQLDRAPSSRAPPSRSSIAPVVDHRLQHDVAARDRAIQVDGRRVARWRLDQAGEQRRLVDGQIARRACRSTRATPPRRRTARRRSTPCSGTARGSRSWCRGSRCSAARMTSFSLRR